MPPPAPVIGTRCIAIAASCCAPRDCFAAVLLAMTQNRAKLGCIPENASRAAAIVAYDAGRTGSV